jgi:hypothetical protein
VKHEKSFLRRSGISFAEIEELVEENPSLRSFVAGYAAEKRLRGVLFSDETRGASDLGKPDDHDRKEGGDRKFVYRGHVVRIESKSLQSESVRHHDGGRITATTQVDGSDCRDRVLPGGETVRTTCLPIGSFDIIAVNCFSMFGTWRFAFARADKLARSTHSAYPESVQKQLLKSSQQIEVVDGKLTGVWQDEPWGLLDELIEEGKLPGLT